MVPQQVCEDERDIMVPGEQLWHSAPSPPRDDLCRPRGLRADAAGGSAGVIPVTGLTGVLPGGSAGVTAKPEPFH